jgi:hypothetical protein
MKKIENIDDLMLTFLENDISLTNYQWAFVRLISDIAKESEVVVNGKRIDFSGLNKDFFYTHIYNLIVLLKNNDELPDDETLKEVLSGTTYNPNI